MDSTFRARADCGSVTKKLVRSVASIIEANARNTRSVSRLESASISAVTARAAALASRPLAAESGSNMASNRATSDRAVEVFSLRTDSICDWLYGKPACRRYLA